MSTEELFEAALTKVRTFTSRPTDQELLDLYGLFKQASFGDNNTSKPGILDIKGKAKWEAWSGRKGMSQNDAKVAYIAFVDQLSQKYL